MYSTYLRENFKKKSVLQWWILYIYSNSKTYIVGKHYGYYDAMQMNRQHAYSGVP